MTDLDLEREVVREPRRVVRLHLAVDLALGARVVVRVLAPQVREVEDVVLPRLLLALPSARRTTRRGRRRATRARRRARRQLGGEL